MHTYRDEGRHITESRTNKHDEIFDVRRLPKHQQTSEHHDVDAGLMNNEYLEEDYQHKTDHVSKMAQNLHGVCAI